MYIDKFTFNNFSVKFQYININADKAVGLLRFVWGNDRPVHVLVNKVIKANVFDIKKYDKTDC